MEKEKTSKTATGQIGNLISQLREDRDMTQAELGKRIGTTQSAIARIENGEQNISTDMISKISDALQKQIVNLSDGSLSLRIEGGHKLSGSVTIKTSKNGAVGCMCAALLNKNKTILRNVPKIEEVYRIIEVLQSIGVSVKWMNGSDIEIKPPSAPAKIDITKINRSAATKTRTAIMLIGPLIHHFNKFSLPQPGGCRLGSRTVKPHFYALEKIGVNIKTTEKNYEISSKNLHSKEHLTEQMNDPIILYESGDTVTENTLMAAALLPRKTIIKYASANYMVQEVCFLLEKMGVKIDGIGTSTLTVYGISEINALVEYELSEDPIEAMSFLAAAIVTKSSIMIERCPIDFIELELLKLEKMGFRYEILKHYKAKNGKTNLVDIKTYPSELTALEEKIHPNVYPGLNIDNLPFFAVIATQASGQTFIHDWVYDERAFYYKELDKLGASTVLADPYRIYINGPTKLRANEIICPPALRPAVSVLVAMLAAEGTSILRNIYTINRGYEDLADRLNTLGAKITILRDL
jgi:UDP-N-acetylglucosamine 1-carboxyvinyltransferase